MAAEAAWVIAIIALMAFIVAAIALAVTLNIYSAQQQTLELQRKQFEEQQRRARREQAAKVSFFVDANNDRQFQLKVINTSDYPILGVAAVMQPRTPNAVALALVPNLLPTGATPYTMTWHPSVLPLSFGDLNTERAGVFGVELWFEDSNGVYWCRNIYGKLAELTDAEQKQLDHLLADHYPGRRAKSFLLVSGCSADSQVVGAGGRVACCAE
jgi:type II secretory pathway pseudopilin PulG